MDKNTLSNYGWIVIAVLVLSVMIALATPFGEYIKAGVESTTAGLFDTSEKALNVVGMSAKTDATEKATAKGSYISVNDVASKQHNLEVNLSSDTITDFSGVSISRYGSNLLDMSKLLNENLVDNGDGTYTLTHLETDTLQAKSAKADVFIPANTTFHISVNHIENTFADGRMAVTLFFDDDTNISKVLFKTVGSDSMLEEMFTFDKDITQIQLITVARMTSPGEYGTFSEPKLNIGQELPYTEYITPQTVISNSDGTVNGLTSISPCMTIITENSDIEITCEYQKKNWQITLRVKLL